MRRVADRNRRGLVGGGSVSAAGEALLSQRRMVAAGLREGIALLDPDEAYLARAAVELVIRADDGWLADPGWPWIREGARLGVFWLDPEAIARFTYRGGELKLLPLVEALAGGRRMTRLASLLIALDRPTLALVFAAFDEAAQAGREIALYAFGGDPRALAGHRLVVWPPDDLDQSRAAAAAGPEGPKENHTRSAVAK
jgi:hypothetical protein